MALVLALTLSLNVVAASASIQSVVESRLTVTFTQTVTGSGSERSISPAVQVSDTQGNLTLGTPTGSQIRVIAFTAVLCAAVQPTILTVAPGVANGCRVVLAPLVSSSSSNVTISQQRSIRGSSYDPFSVSHPIVIPVLRVEDASGNEIFILANLTANPNQASQGNEPISPTLAPQLSGNSPNQTARPGGRWIVSGQNLDQVQSVAIGGIATFVSAIQSDRIELQVPSSLTPGIYDLVLQSPYGLLTWVSAIRVAQPTPTRKLVSKGFGTAINENQVIALEKFFETLNGDYQRIRCIVNASDLKTAESIGNRICSKLARGDLRNIKSIVDARSTVKGSGFYIRVFANG